MFFAAALATFLNTLFGARLPIMQGRVRRSLKIQYLVYRRALKGASFAYVTPAIALLTSKVSFQGSATSNHFLISLNPKIWSLFHLCRSGSSFSSKQGFRYLTYILA